MTSAIIVASATDVVINGNVVRANKLGLNDAAIEIGLQQEDVELGAERVNLSDNDVRSSFLYAVRVRSGSRRVVISDNVITTSVYAPNAEPVTAILAIADRVAISGNVIDHCAAAQSPATGPAIATQGSQNTIAGNTVEMNTSSNSVAVLIDDTQSSCTGNAIGLPANYAGGTVSAIGLTGGSSNCTAVGNTCGTATPVQDSGATNEVAHNT